MTAPFALDAFEKYLRLAAATGDALEVETHLGQGGAVVLSAARIYGGVAIEFRRFLVRGHSAVEVSVHDPRYRPAAVRAADAAPTARE